MKCPSCGFENLAGSDHCEECLHSLMQRDLPRPKKSETMQKIIMTAPVSEVMDGQSLLIANTTDSLKKIVKILQKEGQSAVLVYKKKKVVGIISQRDILHKVAGKRKDLSKVTAQEIMTPNPDCVNVNAPIAYVVNKMSMGGFRHVPVLDDNGTPLSILTIKHVLIYLDKRD